MALPPYDSLIRPENLPIYSSDIEFRGNLLCKKELQEPSVPATHRRWQCIQAQLRGTTLNLHFVSSKPSDLSSSTKDVRRYTLQAADVGLATDYKQHADAFRVRAEGEQLIFIAPDPEVAVQWVEHLQSAIAISEPLDQRSMPKYPALPSRGTKVLHAKSRPGFARRLWQEFSWQARQQQEWLQGTGYPRTQAGFQGFSRAPPGSAPPFPKSVAIVAYCQCPCSTCWRRGISIKPDHEAVAGDPESHSKIATTSSTLRQSQRCTRVLTKWSKWGGGYYVKDGRRVKIELEDR